MSRIAKAFSVSAMISGAWTAMASLVRTGPGAMQLTRMPCSPSSAANCLVRWITAAFEVP